MRFCLPRQRRDFCCLCRADGGLVLLRDGQGDRAGAHQRLRFRRNVRHGEHARAIDAVFIDRRFTGDYRLAQTKGGVNQHVAQIAAHRIDGKGDARRFIGLDVHHLLDDYRHCRAVVGDAEALAVGQDFGIPQAQPALFDRSEQGVRAVDIEQGIVQPGKGGARQILGAAGGAHRVVMRRQCGQRCGERSEQRLLLQVGDHGGTLRLRRVVRGEAGGDGVAVRRDPGAVGVGRQNDAVGDGQSGLRRAGKTKAFAAHTGDVE